MQANQDSADFANINSLELQQIAELMSPYRKLKAEIAVIQTKMDDLKQQIEPLVEAVGGKWKDDRGYARLNTRSDSISFKNAEVENLYKAWLVSKDPIMNSCANMLKAHRTTRPGVTYLQLS